MDFENELNEYLDEFWEELNLDLIWENLNEEETDR